MKLYHSPGASSLAIRIALAESGLPFTSILVDQATKLAADGSTMLEIDPLGLVPALVTEGEALTGSVAILYYIESTTSSLHSATACNRALMIEALSFIATEIHKSYRLLTSTHLSATAKQVARESLDERFEALGERLRDRPFVLGGSYSVADAYLFATLLWARSPFGFDLPEPLSAYFARDRQRPSVRQALAYEGLR